LVIEPLINAHNNMIVTTQLETTGNSSSAVDVASENK
jgi:hypothetical protein